MGYIILDRVTDQALSRWRGANTDKWDGYIDPDTDDVVRVHVFSRKTEAQAARKLLEESFKDESGGVNFEILKVKKHTVPARKRMILA